MKFNPFFILAATTLALASNAHGQGVRSMGMGGALVPGPALEPINPAYHFYQAPFEWSVPLPLGLLNFYLRQKDFSASGGYLSPGVDQVLHWSTLIFNPTTTYQKGVFDGSDPPSLDPGTQLSFRVPTAGGFRVSVYDFDQDTIGQPVAGTFSIGLGIAVQLDPFQVVPSSEYARDYAKRQFSPSGKYGLLLALGGSIGPRVDLTWGMPFEFEESWTGLVGARAALTYNLLSVAGISTRTNNTNGRGSSSITAIASPFYKGGSSIDVSLDAGAVLESADVLVGVGIVGLGRLEAYSGTLSGPSATTGNLIEVPFSNQEFSFARLVTVNGAYRFQIETESMTIPMSVLADAQIEGLFSSSQFYAAHAGLEAGFNEFTARGGLGYDNGLNIAVGGSWQISQVFGLDTALTAQQALGAQQLNFGLAFGLNFKF